MGWGGGGGDGRWGKEGGGEEYRTFCDKSPIPLRSFIKSFQYLYDGFINMTKVIFQCFDEYDEDLVYTGDGTNNKKTKKKIQIIAKDGGAKGTGRSISHDVNKSRSGNSFIASPLKEPSHDEHR